MLRQLFEKYKKTPISDLNREQAMVPSKAEVLHNRVWNRAGNVDGKRGKSLYFHAGSTL